MIAELWVSKEPASGEREAPGEEPSVVMRTDVRLGPAGEVDGAARGRLIEFHTLGPDRVSHYKRAAGEVEKTADLAFRRRRPPAT
ncbi:hypothetical protein ACFWOL_32930 [Streptomyces sp. NPDC058442]|uniref:hypothetical protein n=1 Tax=Streptomyces sp. NPDC058442 TaxID=3346503 RepID=UPI003646B3FA